MKKEKKKFPPFKDNKARYIFAIAIAFLFSFIIPTLGHIYLDWHATGGAIPTILNSYLTYLVFKSILLVFQNKNIEKDQKVVFQNKNTEKEQKVDKKTNQIRIRGNIRKLRLQDKIIIMTALTLMLIWFLHESQIIRRFTRTPILDTIPYVVSLNLFLYWAFFGFKKKP